MSPTFFFPLFFLPGGFFFFPKILFIGESKSRGGAEEEAKGPADSPLSEEQMWGLNLTEIMTVRSQPDLKWRVGGRLTS